MELILSTDITALQAIEFNYDVLYDAINAKMERYRNLVIEESDIPDAKTDRAELNKLAKSIDDERIKIKKKYLEPYDKFEARLKELTAMIKKPCDEIDAKIKEHESKLKQAKREEIEYAYLAEAADMAAIIPLERIFDKSWDTVACKMPSIILQIKSKLAIIKTEIASIQSMNLKHETAILGKYIETLSLSTALSLNSQLMAAERITAVKPPPVAEVAMPTPPVAIDEIPTDIPEAESKYDLYLWRTLRLRMKMSQWQDLKEWLEDKNIVYERIEHGE